MALGSKPWPKVVAAVAAALGLSIVLLTTQPSEPATTSSLHPLAAPATEPGAEQPILRSSVDPERCVDASPTIDALFMYFEDWTATRIRASGAVLSRDPSLKSWLFISAEISDGPRHGDIGTWVVTDYSVETDVVPLNLINPANEAASAISPGQSADTDRRDQWMDLDGALESQVCLNRS